MKEFILKSARDGLAAGPVFDADAAAGGPAKESMRAGKPVQTGPADPGAEPARFEEAVRRLGGELSAAAAAADSQSAAVFEAQIQLLNDKMFAGRVRRLIREEGAGAEEAVGEVSLALAQELAGSSSAYIRQRSEDIRGVSRRLLEILRGETRRRLEAPAIIAAEELSPAALSGMDPSLILGIITVSGAPNSHVSIIAGNLGVPCAYGSAEAVESARRCRRLILEDGKLVTDPEEEQYEAALRRQALNREKRRAAAQITEGSTKTKVCANIGGPEDIPALRSSGADGVGLMRSEFLFLGRDGAPSEEEQYEAYRKVAEAMGGKETVIRTIDLGADKSAEWLAMPEEKNPALGCRGLRLALREQSLFRTQLRALLRAAACGNIRVMVPMVTSVKEVETVRAMMGTIAEELSREGTAYALPPLGIMVETPAAALIAEQLAEKADFFSIGTNDLTQYTLALDREAQGLEDYYDPYHEGVMRLIEMTVQAGHGGNIPVSVCGELAGDPRVIPRLVEMGVDKLSTAPGRVPEVRGLVMEAEKRCAAPGRTERGAGAEEPAGRPEAEASAAAEPEWLLAAPADGQLIPMQDIPDPVFSSGTMGECMGILPDDGIICAPCDGVVSGIAQTRHAITFTADGGREILVHVGIDTVTLGGKGFTVLTREGAAVSRGEKVMQADLDIIRAAGLSPMVITVCLPRRRQEPAD